MCDPKDVRRLLSLGGWGGRGGTRFLCVCLHSSVLGEGKRWFPSTILLSSCLRIPCPQKTAREESNPRLKEHVHCAPHAGEAQARSHSKWRAVSLSFVEEDLLSCLSASARRGRGRAAEGPCRPPVVLKHLKFQLIYVPKRSISGLPYSGSLPARRKMFLSRFTEKLPKGLGCEAVDLCPSLASSSKSFLPIQKKRHPPTHHGLPQAVQLSLGKGDLVW